MTTILFVDDSKEFQRIISSALNRAGYNVTTADNRDEAISKLHESSFDAVVEDLVMPSTDGCQLDRHALDTASAAVTPVIGIIKTSCEIDLSGFDVVLEPPFFLRKLIDSLREFENKYKSENAFARKRPGIKFSS
jgi:twitching motility two-component system response regulator PilH